MANIVVNGLVCRYADYRDNDRMLTLFTREAGRVDAVARGCKRPKSKLMAVAQPFVYAEFELFSNKDKYSVNNAEIKESFYPLRSDLDSLTVATNLAALISGGSPPGEPNERLFSLLYYTVSFLAYSDCGAVDLSLCALLRYLNVLGYCPVITACARCGGDIRADKAAGFDPNAGGALCAKCSRGARVDRLALEAMRRMLIMEDADMHKVKLTDKLRSELEQMLYPYAEAALEKRVNRLDNPSRI